LESPWGRLAKRGLSTMAAAAAGFNDGSSST
jgi:hypothetical protein